MKFTALLVTVLVIGVVYSAPTDQEDVSGARENEAAQERIFDFSRKSRQLFGSALGYTPYSGAVNQGVAGYPYSYSNVVSGYSGAGGYPGYSSYGGNGYTNGFGSGAINGYPIGMPQNTNGIGLNGLTGNSGFGYSAFSPLNGVYNPALLNGAQPLYNDPYSSLAPNRFFLGTQFNRRPY
ncbi:uncharacterized protein LOC129779583 [Toxorhynchites rutilus septentrionalis]|uniref:uncharacterized protein LOC129779583 n=1 Tax=Toxorhynchites rutilus septentrionalis TaxID=329112 RepID=UPI002479B98D|nr:uncharacterized protein LOC129779583 [Toxorhynchites rutilus septentrionalis]